MGFRICRWIHDGILDTVLSALRPFPWENGRAANGDEPRPLDLARLGNRGTSSRTEPRDWAPPVTEIAAPRLDGLDQCLVCEQRVEGLQ